MNESQEYKNPRQSSTIGELASALAKAQGEIKGAVKNEDNPFFKSKYADLSQVMDACREPFSKNGIAYTQLVNVDDSGVIVLETLLMHSSGEWIASKYPILPVKNDPQGVGSAITYARRYSLSAIAGIPQVDDDAEGAMNRPQNVKPVKPLVSKQVVNKILGCVTQSITTGDIEHFEEAWRELTTEEKAFVWPSISAQDRASIKRLQQEV